MDKTEKLVIEYLNASYGENPKFTEVESETYNPYTFALEKVMIYYMNEIPFCKVMFNNEIQFNDRLLMTVALLFDKDLKEIHHVIDAWFLEKKSLNFSLSDVRPIETPTQI